MVLQRPLGACLNRPMDAQQLHDHMVARLFALCTSQGGAQAVADKAKVSAEYLRQVLRGQPGRNGVPRGLGKRVLLKLDSAYPGWMDTQHPSGGAGSRGAVAQVLSEPRQDYAILSWGAIMHTQPLPARFAVELPDDAMAPRGRKGALAIFDRTLTPLAGDGVLVRDRTGALFFRSYREKRPGHWTAEPDNAGFHSLDSLADGLEVLGVLDGVLRNRWS